MEETEFDKFKLEDMAEYFSDVRNKFIRDTNSLWFDNFFVNAILVRAYQINKGFIELTNNGNYECVYELAQMDSLDPDDIINLIS